MPSSFPCQNPATHKIPGHCLQCHVSHTTYLINQLWDNVSEPRLVYTLFFSRQAASEWKGHMALWHPTIEYSGVFTHAKPFCRFNPHGMTSITLAASSSKCMCELGDVLLLFSDYVARQRRAILLQAKIVKKQAAPRFDNPDQRELYSRWPTLRYVIQSGKGPASARLRTLPFCGYDDPSAQIMLLNSTHSTVKVASVSNAGLGIELGQLIDHVINGSAGRDVIWSHPELTQESPGTQTIGIA